MSKTYLKSWKEKKEKSPNSVLSFKQRLRIKQQKQAERRALLSKIKILKTKKRNFLRERQKQREMKKLESMAKH
ncbi:hypothetical protein KMI_03g05570 [Encephalitozoon hellem]|uniref:Uncharacterized protein n=1 Tax=Encephalitozoon hellem TaxID=27973 RepID=A0A9Q9F8A7_ENCHE|nr:uncharacterized protein EHEL_061075 [Encephalitozoon hellem ATCC 50504]AHL28944.1 hypothetical protein EHEL_061075 [Encephalitozoon hellem ATCC 50504]KAG5860106.1 hypothetical protein KMI_03g05570 [Encephalitozoon hellem]UTX43404.1 hypothetical protein GPU96_06g11530 [Encephalitozoon hellem]WEL38868.1 hypothetical protein PFJ87_06g01360 [Encephalitozoon hellem]